MAKLITKTLLNSLPNTKDIDNTKLSDGSIIIHIKLCYTTKLYLIASVERVTNDLIFLCYCIDTVCGFGGQWKYVTYSEILNLLNSCGNSFYRDMYFEKNTLNDVIYNDRIYV